MPRAPVALLVLGAISCGGWRTHGQRDRHVVIPAGTRTTARIARRFCREDLSMGDTVTARVTFYDQRGRAYSTLAALVAL